MTALCGGGPSAAKPDFNRILYIAPAALGAFLNNIPTPWAVALAAFIGAVTYDATQFCLSDPPALPTITAEDVANLLNPINVPGWLTARQKFQDLIFYYLWFEACQCTSTTTPTPAAPPSAPDNMPTINPPTIAPSYPSGQACFSQDWTWTILPPNNSGTDPPITPVPAGSTNISISATMSRPIVTDDATGWQINVHCFNASGTFIGNAAHVEASTTGQSLTFSAALISGTVSIQPSMANRNISSSMQVELITSVFCGAPNNGVSQQPCPADPFTVGLLDQILALVTLIQRQVSPFAYVPAATHAGLSGSGHIAIQGALGVRVTLTTIPSSVGVDFGDPDKLWHGGWVNFGDDSGYSDRRWIDASPITFYPRVAGVYTRLGYSLPPGVVATIDELHREP